MSSGIPKTMLAWQKAYPSKGPIRNEVPVPQPSHDGVLIKILAAGLCHSDQRMSEGVSRPPAYRHERFTMGHEGCGEVVALGSSVKDLKVGDLVSINPVVGCGQSTCGECSRGFPQICTTDDGERYGLGHDGSYAPFQAVKAKACAKLPSGVPPEQGAVAKDACMTAYHAVVDVAMLKKEETVVIFGLGGLGFNALQVAQSIGARVIVVDKRQESLDTAVKFGVPKEDTVSPDEGLLVYTKRMGLEIDTVIDFVGTAESFVAAQNAVRFGGKLVQVGLLSEEIPITNFLAVQKHLSILCSYGGIMDDLKACSKLIAEGKLHPQVEKGSMDEFPSFLSDLNAGKIKSRIALVPDHGGA